ncbi:M20 family peptidase [Companilactobacillus suantsaicola]|uniref:M20 family peptidase n=1 Tax=Companilactobacillus suantsaicola TaxID=2487723 RepID=A0A4Z0JT54_9LACO|nr:Sapep family Mn(2+)-dependent dipeptidase [Companilactobacillus suantsaicola]TGD25398.1 M20 family peptidase [Companilactobacillus suantsaicola]
MNDVREDFITLYSKYEKQFIDYFKGLVSIPSVKGNRTYQAPFGIGPKRALEYMLKLADELGFRVGQISDRVGWLEYGPNTDEYFAVLGHLDVVDVVDDWNYPPFDLSISKQRFFGRGVLDNKGPFISTVFALYLIKEQNVPLKKRIRIIFGTDEESGSNDIPFYLDKEIPPYAGFTPDCKFPIVYGERGLLDLTINCAITDDSLEQIEKISGVFDKSFIPDEASITIDGIATDFKGEKSPSNAPDMAKNVLPMLVNKASSLNGQSGETFKWINDKFSNQTDGKNLGLNFEDAKSGKLQLSFYKIEKKNNLLSISFSMRYPVSITFEQILKQLETELLSNMTVEINRNMPSVVKSTDQNFIKSFSKIYENDTGLNGKPVTTTGATYARSMPNIVAFGPSFPGQKGIAHKGDEWLNVKDWQMMMEIYYDCLKNELC